jgi:hypothetical protein
MNWDDTKKQLVTLTENQAQLFKATLGGGTASVSEANLSGHGMGRVASSLEEKGFIEPMGRIGRQYKWQPTLTWQDNWGKYQSEITYVLDKITEDK